MKTDKLIDMLSRGIEPTERPNWRGRLALTLLAGLVAAVLVVKFTIGMRPDMDSAMTPMMLKAAFSAAAAAAILPLAVRLAKPGCPLGWRLIAVLLFAGLSLVAGFVALMGAPSADRMQAWMGGGFPWCLVMVPILAAPTAAGLVWVMRSLAPTRLTLTGAAIGALSGGVAAMAYAMYCPVDSIAFVTTWYVLAIALCAALGALIGARFLRW